MFEHVVQEQALKSEIDQERAENCTEEELSAIVGGGKENAKQGAATGAVTGAWVGGGYLGYRGAKIYLPVTGAVVGAVGGAGLGAAIGSSIGATIPDRSK